MKAKDITAYLESLAGDWQYPPDTVDTFKMGDPNTNVQGIAVAWMPYQWALERATQLACNLFITHEPTFYDHFDSDTMFEHSDLIESKRRWIEQQQIVIYRCHDLWDRLPAVGIPDSWAAFLDLGQALAGDEHARVYNGQGRSAKAWARHVGAKTASLGQERVQLIGPPDRPIQRLALGTGAITPFLDWVDRFKIDLAICTDDGIDYWRDGAFAIDHGLPIIVVNHPVSEEPGVISLSRVLEKQFEGLPVHHIPQQAMYQLIENPA